MGTRTPTFPAKHPKLDLLLNMAWRQHRSITELLRIGLLITLCVTSGVKACPPGCTCTTKKAPGLLPSSGTGGEEPLPDDADPIEDPGGGTPSLSAAAVGRRGKRIDCSTNPARFTDLSKILDSDNMPLDTIQLDLSNNALMSIPTGSFDHLSMLRRLDLSDNEISLLEPGAFLGLANLERLDLSGNNIGSINASMFTGMPKLEKLYLSKNRINTIPEGTFNALPALKRIDFQSDFLRCDCHLQWMIQWSKDREVRIRASTICAVPREVSGKPLKTLKKKDLHCEHELQLPLFEVSPATSQVVFEGDKLPFECRASIIDTATKMVWLRGGKEVHTNRTVGIFVHTATSPDHTIMTHSLVLESLEKQHNGIWQCRVSTPQGNVSESVTITVISDTATSCPEVTVRTNKGVYVWQRTVAGIQKQQPCKMGEKRAPATYYCNNIGRWENLNVKQCSFISETTRKLQTCAEWDLDDDSTVHQLAQDFLPNSGLLKDSVDVMFASECIARITPLINEVPKLSETVLNAVSSIMKIDKTLLGKAQREGQACRKLVDIVEKLAEQLLVTSSHHALAENIAIEARKMSVTPFPGIACSTGMRRDTAGETPSPHGLEELTCFESMNETLFARAATEIGDEEFETPFTSLFNQTDFDQVVEAAILLPRTLFQKVPVLEGVSMEEVGVTIIVYQDAAIFPITATNHEDPVLQGQMWKPVSPVVAASIGQSVANLTDPVIGLLQVSDISRLLVAAYWDVSANGGYGDWRTDGCKITEQHGNVSVFHCYHLTNFVILQNLSSRLAGVFIMMEPVIYAGSCLLAICLMAVIVTYVTCFKFIRIPKKAKHSVINISISVLLLCIGFTMGVNRTDQERACQIVGIAIHYFTLCTVFWITIASSNMLKKFTKAEEPPAPPPEPIPMPLPPKPILRFYLLGWGVPIIICGITAAVNLNHYSESEYCFLSWDPSLGAFYGPVALLVVINLVFFMKISCVIRGAPNNLNYSDEMEELHTNEIELTPNQEFTNIETASLTQTNATSMSSILDTEHRPISQLRALVATLFLYIVVWVCGAFAVARPFRTIIPRQEIIFSYLYGFTSVVLGGFMLGYYCLMRQDSRSSWKRFFSCEQQTVYQCESELPNRMNHSNGHVIRCPSSVESSSLTGKVVNIHKEQKQQQMKNGTKKQSNINLVPSQTASLTEVSFGSIGQDQSFPSFYNPRQNGVAKKFWEKRHNQTKKINKDLSKEINTCSGSYNSNLDNLLNESASKRQSQCTSSEANTHFSIEIQIQANPRNSGSNGRQPTSQDEMPPSYDSIRRNKQLPMNIQATHQSAFHAVVPYDRNELTPVGGTSSEVRAGSVCSSSHYPLSQADSSIPFCQEPSCMNTLGIRGQNSCGCDNYNRMPRMSPDRSMASSPASEMLQRNITVPRPRDFDGQSQVSQETQGSSIHGIQRLNPQQLGLVEAPQKHLPVLDKDCCTECLNNVSDNMRKNSRRMSDSSKHYRTSSDCYSSDSNMRRRRQKNFLQEIEQRIPVGHTANSPSRSDINQTNLSNNSRSIHHDSDSQLHYYRSRSHDFSDHNSEPSHRKRHHSHGAKRNRYRRHSKQSYGSGLQTSSEWDEQFRDRPQRIPYAYVNHKYRDRLRQKRLQEKGKVGTDPGTKVYWFPRSTSAYDEILPGGMEAMAEDTSSSSDDSIDEDIWVLQKERRNRLKKETSV